MFFFFCCRKHDWDILFWPSEPKRSWMQDLTETLNGIITSGRRLIRFSWFPVLDFGFNVFLSGWKDGNSLLRRTFWQSEARWFTEPPRGSLMPGTRQCSIPVTFSLGNITLHIWRCLHIQVNACDPLLIVNAFKTCIFLAELNCLTSEKRVDL